MSLTLPERQQRIGAHGAGSDRRVAGWLFVLVTVCFLVVQEGAITGYDGRTMYGVTQAVLGRGTLAVDPELNTLPGQGGQEYSRYGLGLSLLAVIPYALTRPLAALSPDPDAVLEAAVSASMAFVAGALVAALYLLARRLGARVRAAAIVGIGGVVGTFALPYGKEFFSEPLAALGLVVGVERLLARRPGWAGLALGLAVLTRPQNLLLLPIVAVVVWRTQGARAVLRLGAGLAPGVILAAMYNVARFGSPWELGYQDVGLTTPFLAGAAGLLAHPLKSLVLFAPIVLVLPVAFLWTWRISRPAVILIGSSVAITFGLTATWFAWHGGWSWGPRLLLPVVVLAVAMVGPWMTTRRRTGIAVGLFAAGFLVSLPAVIVSTQTQQLETPPVPPEAHFLDTQPLASPSFVRQYELIPPVTRYSVEHRYAGEDDGRNYLRYLSLWQFGAMRDLGRTGLALAVAGTMALITVALLSGRRVVAAVRSADGPPTPVVGTGRDDFPTGAENLEAMEVAGNYQHFLIDSVRREADPARPVLDFGAGTGFHARALREYGFDVTCIEPHPVLREQLKGDGFVAVGSAAALEPQTFATAYSLNVLEHIEDDAAALRDIHSRLAPGGKLVLYVPAFAVLFSSMDRHVGHYRRYRRAPLERLVSSASFRVVHSGYVDSVGFAASLVYRLLRRDGVVTTRSVHLYDRVAFPLSRLLDRLIRGSFGKNLLLVAHRD